MRRNNRRLDAPSDPADVRDMNSEPIRKRSQGQGSHRLRPTAGREYLVPHPECVIVGRHNVVIEAETGRLEVTDPRHRVSLPKGTSRTPRNGGRSR